ncbi:MAG: ribosome recycling factor [Paludibacteraceae bacterium]|nr:ribosome recycling factor [Paludibacteraceae bacterium]
MEDPKIYQDQARESMESAIMFLDDTLAHIRAGKASVRILDPIRIEYYGQMSPLSAVATITTPDARTIAIQPWERKMIGEIERAIINSNIGFAPSNNGEVIRLTFPPLTEERRRDLVKQCRAEGENSKVSIRNARRDAIEKFKKLQKDGLPEDAEKDAEAEVQKLHDQYIKKVDELLAAKEKEIMTV